MPVFQPSEIELHRDRVIVPAAGHAPHQRDRLRIGTPFRASAPGPSDAQLRVTAAVPVQHEHNLARRIVDVDDDFLDQDPDDALLQAHVRGGVVPERRQVLRERLQRARIDLLRGDRARIEGRHAGLLLADAFQRRVPAGFECRRHQTLLGIDVFVAAGGELRVIARLFELELQRLPLLPMPFAGPLRRGDRRVNRLRRDGLQDLLRSPRRRRPCRSRSRRPRCPSGDGGADSESSETRCHGRCN